jgi:phosphomannomutase
MKFIFDVDGTLTPSRQKMDEEFSKFFFDFCTENKVYLVTGSDKDKTVEQVGNVIYGLARRAYNCSGADVYKSSKNVRRSDWKLPHSARTFLLDKLEESEFPLRTGLHIEERPGMINFSVVGRNATMGERKLYAKYDTKHNERNIIADLFNKQFSDMQATVGGETGLDIAPIGSDKSQILVDFDKDDSIMFFGDRCDPAGNDFPIAEALRQNFKRSKIYHVNDWKETFRILSDPRLTSTQEGSIL